VILNNFFF